MEGEEAEGSYQCHGHTDEGRVVVAEPHRHGDAAEEGSQGIAQVERRLNATTAQHLAALGMLHDEVLLRRTDAEETGATDEHHRHAHPSVVREEEGGQQCRGGDKLQVAGESAGLESVGQEGTHLVAHHHAAARQYHEHGDAGCAESAVGL